MGDCPATTMLNEKQILAVLAAEKIVRVCGMENGQLWIAPTHCTTQEHCCRICVMLDTECPGWRPCLCNGQQCALEWEQVCRDGYRIVTARGCVSVTPGMCPGDSPTVAVRVTEIEGRLVAPHPSVCK